MAAELLVLGVLVGLPAAVFALLLCLAWLTGDVQW